MNKITKATKKLGRPAFLVKPKFVGLNVDADVQHILKFGAQLRGISMSEYVRRALRKEIDQQARAVSRTKIKCK